MGASACRDLCGSYDTEIEETANRVAALRKQEQALQSFIARPEVQADPSLLAVFHNELATLKASIGSSETALAHLSTASSLENIAAISEGRWASRKGDDQAKEETARLKKLIVEHTSRAQRTRDSNAVILAMLHSDKAAEMRPMPVVQEEEDTAKVAEQESAPLIEQPAKAAETPRREEEVFVELA